MFLKGKNKKTDTIEKVFLNTDGSDDFEVVDLNEQRDIDIENLFRASSINTSRPDKIIIREVDNRKSSFWADSADDDLEDEKPKEKKSFSLSCLFKKKQPEEKKLEYVPLASDLDDGKPDLDFRSRSADWMDKDYGIGDNGLNSSDDDNISFIDALKAASVLQWAAAALAVIIFVSGVMTTRVYANYKCFDRRVMAISTLKAFEAAQADDIAEEVETVEAPIITANVDTHELRILSLVLSSVEKDLKIKLIDDEDTLVKDVDWSVAVTDGDGATTEEEDSDRDGIIHMTDMSAGDYTVELLPGRSLADFKLPEEAQVVTVKAKVEYKVIANIKEEIKTEKEVNAAIEDNGNKPADVEQTAELQDTVEWLESTKTATDEKYVEAEVCLEKTAKKTTDNKLLKFLCSIKSTINTSFGKYSTVAYPVILAPHDSENAAHVFSNTFTSDGNGQHYKLCTFDDCNEKSEEGACDTAGEGSTCSKCGYHTHNYVYDNGDKDENNHTLICKTDNQTKSEPHNFNGNTCSVCGYTKQESHNLTYTKTDETHHNVTCSVSGCTEHNGTNVACEWDSAGKCTKNCGNTKPAAQQEYSVIVDNGTGSGKYKAGADVIVAATVPTGQKFDKWNTTGVSLNSAQLTSYKITFKMPASDVTLIPVFSADEQLYADTAQLYDANMNALYVYDGAYRLATYADYKSNKAQKFYRKLEEFLYTGWQTINGNRYYYNRDNEPVTGDQVIGGVQYHFGTDGVLSMGSGKLGIDVSKYQPSINWSSVKKSGIDYVIIRCGYRGSSTGVLIEDPYFKSHIKGAKAAGLKVGVYFFTTAVSEAEAVEEASMAAYLCSGYGIDYPVFIDCESSPRAGYNGMSASQRTAIIKAFCNTVRSAGYTPGVYANKTWLSSYMNAGELSGYKIWLAQYNSAGPTYSGKYDLWQYTSKGKVDGISGNVDMNQSYLGY